MDKYVFKKLSLKVNKCFITDKQCRKYFYLGSVDIIVFDGALSNVFLPGLSLA